MSTTKEFGDFQTPLPLAQEVVALLDSLAGRPDYVVEPTAGIGAFLIAAAEKWGDRTRYQGYEINSDYVTKARTRLCHTRATICQQDFFATDWRTLLNRERHQRLLVIGNPPWVTNSTLGTLGSGNLPEKSNFQGMRGLDARTGKANFDIAEWILIRLIEALPTNATLAMLCKTMTARKVLRHFWKMGRGLTDASLFLIDARQQFDVAVDACLFFVRGESCRDHSATIYQALSLESRSADFGLVDGCLVSDVDTYWSYRDLDGGSPYTWRSGVKHDAAEVMELERCPGDRPGLFQSSLSQKILLEEEHVFPLLKSSDIGNGRTTPRRWVLLPQKRTGDQTEGLQQSAPRTWTYLQAHADRLDGRKSSIYRNRPRFSIFGIGDYSFAPWKVAISGLYKSFRFVVVPPLDGRPVMLDDTCYFVSCQSEGEARLLHGLLTSEPAQRFLSSLVFPDTKRPITAEILRRISLVGLSDRLGRGDELARIGTGNSLGSQAEVSQLRLVLETHAPYLEEQPELPGLP